MYPFKPGCYAPRNGWHVAAFREEIGEKLLSRWILNQPVVPCRKGDGTTVLGRRVLQSMMDADAATEAS